MTFKKEYILVILIIVGLSVFLIVQKSGRMRYELPEMEQIRTEDVSKMTIRKKDTEIVLVRDNGRWLIAPRNYPADQGMVARMIDAIGGLKLTALVSEIGNNPLYGLGDEKRIEAAVYQGETLLRKIDIGKVAPSYRHTFVRLAGEDRVFHASGNLRSDLDKTAATLRDRVVMKVEGEITGIVLKRGKEEMTLVKTAGTAPDHPDDGEEGGVKEKPPALWKTEDGKTVKEEAVSEIISTLSNLMCEDFIEGAEKDDFSSPVYTITLKGDQEYRISFFDKEENNYAAISSGSDYPFYISAWKAEKMMKPFESLIEPEG